MAGLFLSQRFCDICGRSEGELIERSGGDPKLKIDADGLWVCGECQGRLSTPPVGEEGDEILDEELTNLVGRSAGAICYTLDLPYEPPYQEIIDAASKIAYDEDRQMSSWSFRTQWLDGSTVWWDEEGGLKAIVGGDGSVHIEYR
jgi:hypothetical protein